MFHRQGKRPCICLTNLILQLHYIACPISKKSFIYTKFKNQTNKINIPLPNLSENMFQMVLLS